MHVLALDSTTREGSVALVVDRGADSPAIDQRRGDASRAHAERLPGDLIELIRAHSLAVSDIDVFAVASGPGSFTGLRIGIATMQGLAFATGRPLVAVSALEALAEAASDGLPVGALVAPWMDGYRQDVFAALYEVTDGAPFNPGHLREMEGPTIGAPADTLRRWTERAASGTIWFVGSGALLHADLVDRAGPFTPRRLETPLIAATIGRLALARARAGDTPAPSALHPLYVRRPDAEVARERSGQ